MMIQFLISCAVGVWVFAHTADLTPKAQLFGSAFCGFAATYFLTKLYVWLRFGRAAARSMSLDP
ncbi:MAG: hypothetical protein BGO51_06200 [Rhodospirillales bacterium 69-11]|nr:MAG: hypothetical protein BGO51_06200 [Rhodospirillales bacterium 69-11]